MSTQQHGGCGTSLTLTQRAESPYGNEIGAIMYNNVAGSAVAAGSVGTLAFTGANTVWFALAGFALIAAGTALARMVPRREH
ncbi:MAG: hypothetical protein ABI438_04645 [Dermatophilaceae bacterium]